MSAWAIIVAGGRGLRMGTDIPKQLIKLGGITILERALKPFIHCPDIEGIVIVATEDITGQINDSIVRDFPIHKKISVIKGGQERQHSVLNGLSAIPADTNIVVIHDAVRPFINADLITECIHAAQVFGAATVMYPLKETVKVVSNSIVVNTLNRSSLWITQTPQAFRTELLLKAHAQARCDGFIGTDDSMLVERIGHPVHIIEGTDMNIKITTPTDLKIAAALLTLFENGEKSC